MNYFTAIRDRTRHARLALDQVDRLLADAEAAVARGEQPWTELEVAAALVKLDELARQAEDVADALAAGFVPVEDVL